MSKLDMFNKEYSLELLGNKIRYNKEYVAHDIYRLYIKKNEIKLLEKYLTELQAIKNSKPSEALKLFEEFKGILLKNIVFLDTDLQRLNAIEQYILKAQEQEKVSSILKEKRIDLEGFYTMFVEDNFDYNYYVNRYGTYGLKCLTEEEFNTLKEYFKYE